MKILLTGSTGQLGQTLIKSKPKKINLIETNRNIINLENPIECENFVYKNQPDWIINCAAYTNVDKAEKEKDLARKINALAPLCFAKALKKTGGKILHISTDFVFDGERGRPYDINQEINPINFYGETKAEAERSIKEILFDNNQALIIRTSWVVSEFGNNFVLKILNLLKEKEILNVVCDQIGTPTSTHSLASACWKVITKHSSNDSILLKRNPILHWSDSGVASWYDIAIAVQDIAKDLNILKKSTFINPVLSKDFKTIAKRPHFSVLNCFKSHEILNLTPIYWRKALRSILYNYNTH